MAPLTDYTRLCIHTMTTKPLSLTESVNAYQNADISGITIWRDDLQATGLSEAKKILPDSPLQVVSLCRGGFFPALQANDRQRAIDDNLRAIEEAHTIDAPLIVLVCGAVPGMSLPEARKQIQDGIEKILPAAQEAGVKLSIEPLHPMYADTRSAINTIAQAMNIVDAIDSKHLGITADVFHLWWDPNLETDLARAGKSIFSFHVCDWRTPMRDMLNDRGLMGEGCINIPRIRGWVEQAGFTGPIEVEIFSDEYWATDQINYIQQIKEAYLNHV